MQIVATAEQMRQKDREAISAGIPGLVLMENAGLRVVEGIQQYLLPNLDDISVVVLCGRGNNGGDGFVIARHMRRLGARVKVFALAPADAYQGDAAVNCSIWLHSGGAIEYILEEGNLSGFKQALDRCSVAVDALLGTGLSRPVAGLPAAAIRLCNQSSCLKVAVDIPSGIDSDRGRVLGEAVRADLTVTFAHYKRGLLLYPGAGHAGKVVVGDICFSPEVAQKPTGVSLFSREDARLLIPRRSPDAHKGDSGRAVIAAGSPSYTGAAALSARAALRGGAGLVYLMVPASLQNILAAKLTEAIVLPLAESERGTVHPRGAEAFLQTAGKSNAVAVGPGLGRGENVREFLEAVLPRLQVPVVIDADGLNALAGNMGLLEKIGCPMVLTPHPGEMSRLTGLPLGDIQGDRVEIASRFARRWGVNLVLKGAPTVVAAPDGAVVINSSGNSALATAGSGDVLTGLITALLATGLPSFRAAILGVYLHGRAGEAAEKQRGGGGVIAGDVVECIGFSLEG